MNVLKALKVAELRKKLAIIPAKIIISLIFYVVAMWDTSLQVVWENAKVAPGKSAMILFIIYGAVSYVYFFIRLMHNWIFGLIVSAGVAVLVYTQVGKLGEKPLMIAFIVMLLGGPFLDLINLFRYKSLKDEVIRAEESRMDERYGDGYEDGYRKGIREGKRKERRRLSAYEDEREYRRRRSEEYLEHRRRNPRLERYDDDYEEEYEEYDDTRSLEYDEYDNRYDEYDDEYYDDYDDSYDKFDEYEDDNNIEDYIDDDYIEDKGRSSKKIAVGNSEDASGFFADCKTAASVKRRYHDLCKVYHPDSGNGSTEIFYKIKEEYDRRMSSMS